MNLYEKLANVQKDLKAPKNQFNSFGKYNYRSCEDILEAVKPLCISNGLVLSVSDEVVVLGDRYYVKATATVIDIETPQLHSSTAFARESLDKKGMDDSQITGTASSYARKYALNGLFCIDDTKDADSDEHPKSEEKKQPTNDVKVTTQMLEDMAKEKGFTVKQILDKYTKESGKACTDIKFIPQEKKQSYYDSMKALKQ